MAERRNKISDGQWEQIKDMFPRAKTGRPPKDNRLMLNAILCGCGNIRKSERNYGEGSNKNK